MKGCQLRDRRAEGMGDASLAPHVQALWAQAELAGEQARAKFVDESGMGVTHSPLLHAPFKTSSHGSLNALLARRQYTALMINGVGERIRQRLDALGMDQTELARLSTISVQRLNNYVQGRRTPDLATIVRLASALQTTTDWLLGAEDTLIEAGTAVWGQILELAGHQPHEAEVMIASAIEALRLLAVLPAEGSVDLRSRMAAQTAWHSRQRLRPS